MNYLTNYYKNLCEQLQERINILEAGYQKAIRSGKKEQMEKELQRQLYLEKLKAERAAMGFPSGTESYDVLNPEVKRRMQASPAKKMSEVLGSLVSRVGDENNPKRQSHKKQIESLAMQLAAEHPEGGSRIKVSDLPAESPFGTDIDPTQITPSHY